MGVRKVYALDRKGIQETLSKMLSPLSPVKTKTRTIKLQFLTLSLKFLGYYPKISIRLLEDHSPSYKPVSGVSKPIRDLERAQKKPSHDCCNATLMTILKGVIYL